MAEAMMNTTDNPNYVTPEGYVGAPMPESQDAVGLDLGMYNLPEYANKEDMGLLNTTLDGIVNMLSALDNKMNDMNNKVSDLNNKLNYIDKMRGGGSTYQKKEGQGESGEKKKTRQTDPCYICKELGHWAPDCPKKDLCYKCGKFGHWANKCTEDEEDQQFVKEVEKLEKKPQEPKISGTHQTKPPVKGDKKEKKRKKTERIQDPALLTRGNYP
ncbi:uncharacterized protein LOC134256594 [Saccostrea cucullata]|uniref:uncharacterized protein LOC134256594 n=1 Tax=Saccostrea cuccullata TaxID=36930 RepID=UPI002ED2C8FB